MWHEHIDPFWIRLFPKLYLIGMFLHIGRRILYICFFLTYEWRRITSKFITSLLLLVNIRRNSREDTHNRSLVEGRYLVTWSSILQREELEECRWRHGVRREGTSCFFQSLAVFRTLDRKWKVLTFWISPFDMYIF